MGGWKARNKHIFKEIKPFTIHICFRIIAAFFEYCKYWKEKAPRAIVRPILDEDLSIGYFDGVEREGSCRASFILRVSGQEVIKGSMKAGYGSNTRVELVALWDLLLVAVKIGVMQIVIAGNSKIIIRWANGDSNLQALLLEHWLAKVWCWYHPSQTSHSNMFILNSIQSGSIIKGRYGMMDGVTHYEVWRDSKLDSKFSWPCG